MPGKLLTVTLSNVKTPGVNNELTLEELAQAVRSWCERHRVFPANGQAAEDITERNIRYYRTLGLLDPPIGKYAKTFFEKHRLQLIAIRIYQAQGLPLRKIRDELYGKNIEDLVALEKQASKRGKKELLLSAPLVPPAASEAWSVVPLLDDFLLISRRNRPLPRGIIDKINLLLRSAHQEPRQPSTEPSRN